MGDTKQSRDKKGNDEEKRQHERDMEDEAEEGEED